jgi:hypothetical protein
MRIWMIVLALSGCPSPDAGSGGSPSEMADGLRAAWEQWKSDPSAGVDRLSVAAAEAQDVPIGDREFDLLLGEVLSDGLLRPDLGYPRLEPYADSLEGARRDVWLNTLLRHNDLPAFSAEIQRLHGLKLDPEQPALRAAMNQAVLHREIRWNQALYAHQAAALASRQIDYGRPEMDQPFKRLDHAVEALQVLMPGWEVQGVLTRTTLQTDPDPYITAGEIPVQRDTRRVIAYASTADALDRALETSIAAPPQRTFGLVVRVSRGPDEILLCGEGKFREGQYWMVSACQPDQTYAWMRASELYADLIARGSTPDETGAVVHKMWRDRFYPGKSPSKPSNNPTP